jgi:hypothetical protein
MPTTAAPPAATAEFFTPEEKDLLRRLKERKQSDPPGLLDDLKELAGRLERQPLVPQKMLMTQDVWDDIVKWSKGM